MKPTRSLHLGALSLTGIGTLIALPAFLLIEILDRNYTGELFLLSALLMTRAPVATGGLLTLTVDGVLRFTGHRFQRGEGLTVVAVP